MIVCDLRTTCQWVCGREREVEDNVLEFLRQRCDAAIKCSHSRGGVDGLVHDRATDLEEEILCHAHWGRF